MTTFDRSPLTDAQLDKICASYNGIKTGLMKSSFDKQFLTLTKNYTTDQLLQINKSYYKKFKESISDFITRQMKDHDILDLTNKVLAPKHLAWAMSIKTAFDDLRTNTDLLITTIIMMEPKDIRNTKLAYRIQYQTSLEADLMKVCPGQTFWQKLILKWVTRDQSGVVVPRFNPKRDALKLLEATRGMGTDENKYLELFCGTNNDEFLKMLEEYPKLNENTTKEDFYKDLDGEFEGLDLYASKLVIKKQYGLEQAIGFFFSNCFNDDTASIKVGGKGLITADVPMLNFITSCFRDQVDLEKASPGAKKQITSKIFGTYEDFLVAFWFQIVKE